MPARPIVLAALLVALPRPAGATTWTGMWGLDAEALSGVAVTYPSTGEPGSAVRVAPDGTGPGSGHLVAWLDATLLGFDGVHVTVDRDLDPSLVHAQVRVDGAVIAVLDLATPSVETLSWGEPGTRLELEVLLDGAPSEGWHVELRGIRLDRGGFEVAWSPDAAGLDAWIEAPDRVRFGMDPDRAELGWPVAGSVTVSYAPPGGVSRVAAEVSGDLPEATFRARVGVDGEAVSVFDPGTDGVSKVEDAGVSGARLELTFGVLAPAPPDADWSLTFDDLRWNDDPSPEPETGGGGGPGPDPGGGAGSPVSNGGGASGSAGGGCGASRGMEALVWLAGWLLGTLLVFGRGPRDRSDGSAASIPPPPPKGSL